MLAGFFLGGHNSRLKMYCFRRSHQLLSSWCNEDGQRIFHRPCRSDDNDDRYPWVIVLSTDVRDRLGGQTALWALRSLDVCRGLFAWLHALQLRSPRQWLHAAEGMLILHRRFCGGGRNRNIKFTMFFVLGFKSATCVSGMSCLFL